MSPLAFKNLTNAGTTVFGVTINEDSISALKGTNNIIISCAITLNTTIGPDYSALSVTWTHNGSQYDQDTVLQATSSGEESKMFTSVLTIDSNEFSDSGSYCCVTTVIGSGVSNKMDCVTLNVLGKLFVSTNNFYLLISCFYRYHHIWTAHRFDCWNYLHYYLYCTRS